MTSEILPVFLNAAAGRARDDAHAGLLAALNAVHVDAGIRAIDPREFAAAIRQALATRPAALGVAGGDGSLRAAASALAGRPTALAAFPTGSINHFARRHGIDTVAAAAEAVAGRQIQRVPVGVADDEVFLNTATFGYYAEVVRRRERWRRWLSKWPAAVVAFASLLTRRPHIEIELDIDGERVQRTTPLLWIGLGWGAFPRVHQAAERRERPDLEIAVLRLATRRALAGFIVRMLPQLVLGERPVHDPELELFHARSAIVRAPADLDATMDGELFRLRAPVLVGVLDDALRLFVPPATREASVTGAAAHA